MSGTLKSRGMSRHAIAFILCFPRVPKDLFPNVASAWPSDNWDTVDSFAHGGKIGLKGQEMHFY